MSRKTDPGRLPERAQPAVSTALLLTALILWVTGCNLENADPRPEEWIKTFGIIEEDSGVDVTIDAFGNIYVVGTYTAMANIGFDDEPYYLTADDDDPDVSQGKNYIFVTKYSPRGQVLWSRNIKTNNTENNLRTMALRIALDDDQAVPAVYVAGFFSGTIDFDPAGGDRIRARSARDVFVSKYHGLNGSYLWTRTLGGGSTRDPSRPTDLTARGGAVYVTGLFHDHIYLNTDHFSAEGEPDNELWHYWRHEHNNSPEITFPTFPPITYQNTDNSFVVRINADGSYAWGKAFPAFAAGLAVDDARGLLYVTGGFLGTIDFDPGPGTWEDRHTSRYLLTANTDEVMEFFVSSLRLADGAHAGWAEAYGKPADSIGTGTTDDLGVDLALDEDGNLFLAGMMRRRGARHWHLATLKINGPGGADPFEVAWEKYNTDFWWDYDPGGNRAHYRLLADWTPRITVRDPYVYIAGCYADPFDGQPSGRTLYGFRARYGWGPGGDDIPQDGYNDLRRADKRNIFVSRRHTKEGTYMGTMTSGGEGIDVVRGFDVSAGRNVEHPVFVLTGVFQDTIAGFHEPERLRTSGGKTDGFIIRTRADFPLEVPVLDSDGTVRIGDDGMPVTRKQIDDPPEGD